jgi:2,4-dienoyl-CoA reductase-like NADH-dependent reductase (Old Yellow Enzyme family)
VTLADRDSHRRFQYRDPAELLGDISALELDIPWADDTSPLLEPLKIGARSLPNRLAVHPMEGFDAAPDGSPTELAFRRYRRFASGGSGLIWFEATAVAEAGRSNPNQLFLHERTVRDFERLVAKARRAARESMGSGHDPTFVLQLTHSGRWSRPTGARRPVIVRHEEMLDRMVDIDATYPLVTDEELDRMQDTFVQAAGWAAAAGFDGVDVKSCHGYLGSELLAAFTRTGRYGGTLENRTRFLLETVDRIRSELPSLLVTSRINVFDGLPYPCGFGASTEEPHRPDLTEPRAVLRQLGGLDCSVANISLGIPYCMPHLGRPFNRAVPGSPSAPEHPLVGIARFLRVTEELQRDLPTMSLVGTGYSWLRHFFPNVGAAVTRRGGVSIVGVGRMAFAYPDFARDLVEHGRLDPRKSCVGCSGCSELMRGGEASGCIVRDGDLYRLPRRGSRKEAGA